MMKKITISLSFILLAFIASFVHAQCAGTALTYTVDLSSKPDSVWISPSAARSGDACADLNCIQFVVLINPKTTQVKLDFASGSIPAGANMYTINCGPYVNIGTPACVDGLSSFCLTYCKPGGNINTYSIAVSRGFNAGPDTFLREGCMKQLIPMGFAEPTITWNSVFPLAPGTWNSFLNCTSACDTANIIPGPGSPAYIDYKVCGQTQACTTNFCDTVRVFIDPPMDITFTPASPFICTTNPQPVILTANPVNGNPSFTYLWSSGSQTSPSITVTTPGTETVTVTDNTPGCPPVTQTVSIALISSPSPPTALNSGPVCEGSSLTLTASAGVGVTYNWTGPNGFVSSSQNPFIAVTTMTEAGTYSVTATLNGCTSNASTTIAAVDQMPTANAGTNQTVCENNNVTSLSGSITVATSSSWTTTGDGTFSPDNLTLNASYNPGPADLAAGSVVLTLTSGTNGTCSSASDNTTITITPGPTSNAGTDMSMCTDGLAFLSGSYTIASGGIWTSTGTGTFGPNNTTMNPIYTPSSADISAGTVTLILTTTGNGTCLPESDSVTYTIIPNANITGTISYSGGALVNEDVFLIKQGIVSSDYDTISITTTDATGMFDFTGINAPAPGNYYLRAEADTSIYPLLISTYFGDQYLWDSASVIAHTCYAPYTANVLMIELPAGLSGPCSISGYVYEGAGFGQKLISGVNPVVMANVIPGVPVKVGKNPSGTIVATGFTDSTGYFSFGNLPYDTYTIYTDIPGYPMDSSYTVVLTSGNENADNMNYVVDSNSVQIDLTTSVNSVLYKTTSLVVYPNPTNGTITLKIDENLNETLRLFDLGGRMIYSVNINGTKQTVSEYKLNLNQLGINSGTYILEFRNAGKKCKINYIKP